MFKTLSSSNTFKISYGKWTDFKKYEQPLNILKKREFLAINEMDLYRFRTIRQKSRQKLKLDKLNQDSLDPFESEDDVQYDVQKILTQVDKNQK